MSKSERPDAKIREVSKEFSFDVVTYTIQVEEMLTSIICLQLSKEWMKTFSYRDYFENVGFDNKINLAEIILETNYPKILEKFPTIFEEIRNMKKLRNLVSHRNRHYEMDSEGKNTKFVLTHRIIKKQIRLNVQQMKKETIKLEKCVKDVEEILNLIANHFGIRAVV